MINKQIYKKIRQKLDEFNVDITEIDFALNLLASAVNDLDKLSNDFTEKSDINLFAEKLNKIEEQLILAKEKFKIQRVPFGEETTKKYITLISDIKKLMTL